MKKFLCLVVLAVAVGTTVSAQDIGRMFDIILNGYARYEQLEGSIDYIRTQTGMTRGHGRVTYNTDYMAGVMEERYQNKTVGVWTSNYYIRIAELFVTVYKINPTGLEQIAFVSRNHDYGSYWLASDVVCGNWSGLKLNIINNLERTMVWIWNGNNLYKGFTIRQIQQERSRLNCAPPRYKPRYRRY